jgi:hypothetical protein
MRVLQIIDGDFAEQLLRRAGRIEDSGAGIDEHVQQLRREHKRGSSS